MQIKSTSLTAIIFLIWIFGWLLFGLLVLAKTAHAHFADRPDLNDWVSHLQAGNGAMCCDFTDAEHLTDVEWDTKDGHYRVFLDNHWIDVPDQAVVTVPNKYGPAVVWPSRYDGKVIDIRCFLPGTLS